MESNRNCKGCVTSDRADTGRHAGACVNPGSRRWGILSHTGCVRYGHACFAGSQGQSEADRRCGVVRSLTSMEKAIMKVALITGVTGQDGAYLAEFLLDKGYIVHGIKRRTSLFNTDRIDHLYQDPHEPNRNFILHYGDLTDSSSLIRIIQQVQPDEIYNLAAQSHVAVSLRGAGIHRQFRRARRAAHPRSDPHPRPGKEDALLPGLHLRALRPGAGDPAEGNDAVLSALALRRRQALRLLDHRQLPRGLWHVRLQRHPVQSRKSPMRGETFVTRKITRALARIKLGLQDCLYLGNLDALRDWGHARTMSRCNG